VQDSIDPRDFDAAGDQLSQSLFDFRYKLWVATAHANGISSHFGKVICGKGQACNPARIDLKRSLLTQFPGSCLINKKVLPRAPCPFINRLGCRVENDSKACVALAAGRGAQHNVR